MTLTTQNYEPPTMTLLIGIKTSFTVYPMKPMITKPIAQATAIFLNSLASGFVQRWISRRESFPNSMAPWTTYPTGLLLSERKGIAESRDAIACDAVRKKKAAVREGEWLCS